MSEEEIVRDYPINKLSPEVPTACDEETQRQRLGRLKKSLQDRIKDIDRALELLDKNPDMEELHDLLRRV